MQIIIRSKGLEMTEAMKRYTKSRIRFTLSRFSDAIRKVEVFITDVNGPRGGVDKSCIIKIKTDKHSELVMKDIDDNFYAVVARALSRAKKSLARHIQRAQLIERNKITTNLEESQENFNKALA